MHVLTWFGTVVRVETATKMLIHAPFWPSTEDAADIQIEATARNLTAPADVGGMAGVTMEPGGVPGMLHFRRDGRYLRTNPAQSALSFVDTQPEGPETFLLLNPAEAQCLRVILSHAWTLEPHGARLPAACLRIAEGFMLQLGDLRLDLSSGRPVPEEGTGRILLQAATELAPAVALRRAPEAEDQTPVVLRSGRRSRRVADTASPDVFRVTRDRRLLLIGNPEYVAPPLTVCDTDGDWVFMRHAGGTDMPLGRQMLGSQVHRESGKLVLLTTGAEGLVLDANGSARTSFRVDDIGATLPPWMQRNGDAVYIDRSAIDDAPSLHGAHMVVGHSALPDRGRGRLETLLTLDILGRFAPQGAKLLLPASLPAAQAEAAADIPGLLHLFGFAELPAVTVDRPLCRVEEAIWLEGASLDHMPAKLLREFRARLPGGPRSKGRRILLRQRDGNAFANDDMMAEFAEKRDFELLNLDDFSAQAQIDLFAEAGFVIAAHGAALANLIFAQQGTKVLEISPDSEFRPHYWRMAGKLGLPYAVLPCPAVGRGPVGALKVPKDRLTALFRMLNTRL